MSRSPARWSLFSVTPRKSFTAKSPLKRQRRRFEQLESRTMLAGHGDFNGDGFDDLAIGAPGESVSGMSSAGAVSIVYGGRKGLSAAGNQFWHQDVPGVNGVAAASDQFGFALAIGDFDGDGFDDLAIGVRGEAVSGRASAGAVNVLYGSSSGLRAGSVDQLWTQDSPGINDSAETDDRFGSVLTAGDFNGDGRDDLAIGAFFEDVGTVSDAGMVNVLYGSASGLSGSNDQHWHQNSSGINDVAETSDAFGFSLTAGDFNGDGRDDLAIGVLGENIGAVVDAGAVNVIYGSAGGLTGSEDQFWHQDSTGVPGTGETSDVFGSALAAGDFNGDGRDDLAVGAAGENSSAGAAFIFQGSAGKLVAVDFILSAGILGFSSTAGAQFGESLATGDFDGDGNDDLAIGAPTEVVTVPGGSGAVYAIYGSSGTGLISVGAQRWTQDTGSVQGASQTNDQFGTALTTGDYDGDRRSDLAIGASGDVVGGVACGAVNVIYSFLFGLIDVGNQLWHQNLLTDGNEASDIFGGALA